MDADYVRRIIDDLLPREPMIVGIVFGEHEATIASKTLDGRHPADLFDSFTAPAEWDAVAVVAHGRRMNATTHETTGRMIMVVIVDRAGDTAGRMVAEDGILNEPPRDGGVLAAMRRCLGLGPLHQCRFCGGEIFIDHADENLEPVFLHITGEFECVPGAGFGTNATPREIPI